MMKTQIHELSRVRQYEESKLWVVEILSPVTGTWIAQGTWRTEEQAKEDRKNWL